LTGSGVVTDGLFELIEKISGVLGEETLAEVFNGDPLPFMNQKLFTLLEETAKAPSAIEKESKTTDSIDANETVTPVMPAGNEDTLLAGDSENFEEAI